MLNKLNIIEIREVTVVSAKIILQVTSLLAREGDGVAESSFSHG